MAHLRLWPLLAVLLLTLPALSQAQILNWFGWGAKPTILATSETEITTKAAVLANATASHSSDVSSPEESKLLLNVTVVSNETSSTVRDEKDLIPATSPSSTPGATASPSAAVSSPSNQTSNPVAATKDANIVTTLNQPSGTVTTTASLNYQLRNPESPETVKKPLENQIFSIFQVEEEVNSSVKSATPTSKDESTSLPEASTTQKTEDKNIAGVGAEILNVAENIRSFMNVWEEKEDLLASTVHPLAEEALEEIINVTLHTNQSGNLSQYGMGQANINTTTETHTLMQFSLPSNLTLNVTQVPSKNDTSAQPGIASLPVNPAVVAGPKPLPNQSFSENLKNVESLPKTSNSELKGPCSPPTLLDSQTTHMSHTGSMRSAVSMKMTGSLASGLSHYVINSSDLLLHRKDVTNSIAESDQSNGERIGLPKHYGIAATTVIAPAPNTHVIFSKGHHNANPSDPDLLTSTKATTSTASRNNHTETSLDLPKLTPSVAHCLPVPTNLPFCHKLGIETFLLPNYLNHSSVLEVKAALHDWEGLLKSHCHLYLEWFFCLLLVPRCNTSSPVPPPVPCQGYCKALQDACWDLLKGVGLPVSCDALPKEDSGASCVYIHFLTGSETLEVSNSSSEWAGK